MKMFSSIKWVFPLCYLLLFQPLSAQSETLSASEPVQAELIAEEQSVQPGRPFWVGVELKMEDGWDTYWMNPGDSGFPTQVNWQLPDGFTAGPIEWPYPETFTADSLVAFGYTDKVLLLSEITPPKNLPADQPITLEADVSWLACKDACVPGNAHLSLSLPVSDASPLADGQATALFAQARSALPQQVGEGDLTVQALADEIVMNFQPQPGTFGEIEQMQFIPEQGEVIDYAAPQPFQVGEEGITLNVKKAVPGSESQPFKGVLLVSEKGSAVKRAIHVDSASAVASATRVSHGGVSSLGMALAFAFLGGLILNVMPCVLPVIALKIFGFVKMAHERRSVILKHGGVFGLGVLVSFWLLSGALLALRAYGEGIGWGFQLQEPVFVAILAGILFLLGLSLFGLFELGTSMISLGGKAAASEGSSPLKSSFMSGVLATLVATPCTGPMLGPALGFAMTLPAIQALLVFTMMGMGMAFPYLLFSAFPKLVRFLPKPGNWMITFKHLMGFVMMATVVWLVWVFGAQTDNMAIFVLLASLLVLAVGAWIFGRWGAPTRRKTTRMVATVLAACFLFVGSGATILTAKQYRDFGPAASGSGAQLVSEEGWEAYDPDRVQELRAQGVPVFVDFTAKWCLICQANKVTLRSAEITKAFKEKGVVTMSGDWTKKDPVITEQLEKLGRTGVPVYVLYPGSPHDAPSILPQTLSSKVVHEYLDKLETPKTTVYAD
ncbi:MAG: Thiol:disulfide interchange protein DsbD [Chlamydiales bacterium]|nr:Thiol:disulfide interchange protein DsbD [Chlamydiales bacterium]